ncbi:MAG TPA: TetR/AcrR family transcriptional regulator [Nocardioides sp.]
MTTARDLAAATPRRVGRPAGGTEHGAASRARIIAAAAGVFVRLGYDKARMADVVEASGLTKGSVYFHFESKEALAVAVLSERHAHWLDRVRTRLATAAPGVGRLEALLRAMLDLHAEDPDAWVISRLAHNLAEQPSTRELATELTRRWIDEVAAVVREAQAPAGAGTVDATALATLMVAGFDGLKYTIPMLTADTDAAEVMLADQGALLLLLVRAALGTQARSSM